MSILQVEDIVSGYGSMEVLHEVSVEVEEGKIVTLLGPNGSGKTTLLRTILGIVKPKQGRVTFKGEDITGLDPDKTVTKGLSYVPQEENIFPSLSVQENLEMGAFTREDDWQSRVEEIYGLFPDISNRRTSRAGELSGGMRQMLAIGRALMLNPEALLLDEPSTGLAPFLVDQIFEKIQELNRQGVTVFLVEQNAQALQCADSTYILEGGEKKAEGSAQEIMADEEIGRLYLGR
jgi:ABC-type branched-subunit amino acid transport system ATPase component